MDIEYEPDESDAPASEFRERAWPRGSNEPCWCGSDRKYKRCCGGLATRDLATAGV
ncbi:MAG: SEC-C metal-binding domain-containing protein [Solirubrobacteraceae bacterium]